MIDYTPKKKQESFPKFARTNSSKRLNKSPVVDAVYIRQTRQLKSLVTPGGSTALPSAKHYTGDKIIGIATMHKSNMTPVFSKEDAIDISKMRR